MPSLNDTSIYCFFYLQERWSATIVKGKESRNGKAMVYDMILSWFVLGPSKTSHWMQ